MSEKTYDIKPIGLMYICDVCKTGEMQQTGFTKLLHPPLYTHRCAHCGVMEDFFKRYPDILWERV